MARTKDKEENPWVMVSRVLSLTLVIPISTLVGYGIGYFLDKTFHTSFLKIVFIAAGVAAGILDVYREIQRDMKVK